MLVSVLDAARPGMCFTCQLRPFHETQAKADSAIFKEEPHAEPEFKPVGDALVAGSGRESLR
jgi:hypothetical protein